MQRQAGENETLVLFIAAPSISTAYRRCPQLLQIAVATRQLAQLPTAACLSGLQRAQACGHCAEEE